MTKEPVITRGPNGITISTSWLQIIIFGIGILVPFSTMFFTMRADLQAQQRFNEETTKKLEKVAADLEKAKDVVVERTMLLGRLEYELSAIKTQLTEVKEQMKRK